MVFHSLFCGWHFILSPYSVLKFFRSLTPNPKLSEIVEAVRNLQVAVQDDSGVPTGKNVPHLTIKI